MNTAIRTTWNKDYAVCVVGTLHVGDEIREINSISVANQTVEQLQRMLVSGHCVCTCVYVWVLRACVLKC